MSWQIVSWCGPQSDSAYETWLAEQRRGSWTGNTAHCLLLIYLPVGDPRL